MKAIVWTQPNCRYCTLVKALLTKHGFEIEEKDIGEKGSPEREEFRTFIGTTTPQVIIGQTHIGGFEDTEAFLAIHKKDFSVTCVDNACEVG